MSRKPLTQDVILEALRGVEDPEVHKSIVEMDMVRDIEIYDGRVSLQVLLTISGCPLRTVIETQVREALFALGGVTDVAVRVGTMSDEERKRFADKIRGVDPATPVSPLLDPQSRTAFISVASGKGGVGKSTVTANLAVALAHLGLRVGVMDADIYGFSLPNIFGVADMKPAIVENVIMPVQTHGVKLVSMQFFVPGNRPVVWRGPMLGKMLRNFFQEVHWGDLDVLLLDLPPGTGDVALDVHNLLPGSRELIVTTPQANAADVAVRAGLMAQQTKHDILGVIENMSYYVCGQCDERAYLFGQGGGQRVADELGVTVLGQIPLGVMDQAGSGGLFAPESLQGQAFAQIATTLAEQFALTTV